MGKDIRGAVERRGSMRLSVAEVFHFGGLKGVESSFNLRLYRTLDTPEEVVALGEADEAARGTSISDHPEFAADEICRHYGFCPESLEFYVLFPAVRDGNGQRLCRVDFECSGMGFGKGQLVDITLEDFAERTGITLA